MVHCNGYQQRQLHLVKEVIFASIQSRKKNPAALSEESSKTIISEDTTNEHNLYSKINTRIVQKFWKDNAINMKNQYSGKSNTETIKHCITSSTRNEKMLISAI